MVKKKEHISQEKRGQRPRNKEDFCLDKKRISVKKKRGYQSRENEDIGQEKKRMSVTKRGYRSNKRGYWSIKKTITVKKKG